MTNLFLNETFTNGLNISLSNVTDICLIISLICFLALSIMIYLSSTELFVPESNLLLGQAVKEKSAEDRGNIDIRYAIIQNGVYMHDHNNSQTNTPNRASVFFYDSNNRSGNAIFNMPSSNTARRSLVTVSIDGVATKGFCVYGVRAGNNDSRIFRINSSWLLESQVHSTVTTLNRPLVGNGQGYEILSSHPRVTSFEPTNISSLLN